MTDMNREALTRALSTLCVVTQELARGVNKEEFEKKFRHREVSPGVSVRQHLKELRLGGSLDETPTTMRLKPRVTA